MRTKPFLLASALAVILSLSAAPAQAQFYGGGIGGIAGRGFVTVPNAPLVMPGPVYAPASSYYYAVPGQSVLVRPVPPPVIIQPQPYGVYRRPGWGARPYGPFGPRRPGNVPFNMYGRRGW